MFVFEFLTHFFRRGHGRFRVTPVVPRNLPRFVREIGNLRLTQQQGLAVRPLVAFIPVHGGLERRLDRLDGVRIVAGTLQRLNHAPGHGFTGANARGDAVDPLQRIGTVRDTPVALQAL